MFPLLDGTALNISLLVTLYIIVCQVHHVPWYKDVLSDNEMHISMNVHLEHHLKIYIIMIKYKIFYNSHGLVMS